MCVSCIQMQSSDYIERMGFNGPIDDSEPIYDRLIMTQPSKSNSPPLRARSPSAGTRSKPDDRMGYTRVNRKTKPSRESVVPFANQFKNNSNLPEPQLMEYSVEEYSPGVRARISSSTKISEHKSHTASLLTEKYSNRRAATQPTRRPNVSSPGVNELSKRFSFGTSPSNSSNVPNGRPASKIPTANTPLKATTSASEMTKSPNSLPAKQIKPVNKFETEVKLRNGISPGKIRPNSWDFSSIMQNNKVEDVFVTKDDSTPHSIADIEAAESFHRNSNIRTAFRRKSSSHEMSPEPGESYQEEERNPQHPESPKLSQGSNSSQNSGPPMSVRERTIKWESRGGGLPSYFSTLPKSFRHKATDNASTGIPSPTSSLNMRASPRRALGDSTDLSTTGIPQPLARQSPRSSVSSETKRRPSPSREDADGSSNPDDSLNRRQRKNKTVSITVKNSKNNNRENMEPARVSVRFTL